jgi:8-hydroxy-5-deazaflavin:NADPH oxidoreductase
MKLGFIGSGGVARTLGTSYGAKGYQVKLGSRDPNKLSEWLAETSGDVSTGTFSEAAKFGDVIFLSVLGEAAIEAIDIAGRDNFDGKTVIDLTNPLDFSGGVPPKFTAAVGNSLGEQIQRALPNAHVVKAFNSIGASVMIDPKFGNDTATHFIAGNSEEAKAEAAQLVREFGWDVEDLGGIDQAFFLEAFASMWINYGFKYNDWAHAFKFLKK